jgi:NADH-quinone oxidoreductase subunit C
MSAIILEKLKARFGAAILETGSFRGDEFAVVEPKSWHDVARFLRDDSTTDLSMFIDITVVDYPERDARFEVVMHLYSLHKGHRIRLKASVTEEHPSIASITDLWLGANWFEREAWDMFGVRFEGHPDLRRILMYDEFEGHPLRKDYAAQRTQPLVPYREGAGVLDKLAPFRADEGMPFGRNDWRPKKVAWGDEGAVETVVSGQADRVRSPN